MVRFGPSTWLLFSVAILVPASAQDRIQIVPRPHATSRPSPTGRANLRFDVQLVQVPVVVTDVRGEPVLDLDRSAFRLFDDEVEHRITTFGVADAPMAAALVFDSSRSMKGRIADARTAVEQFLGTAMPEDQFALVRFSDKAELLSSFTNDPAEISRKLGMVEPRGWTSLFYAIYLSTHEVRKAHNPRRALVVFSDGGDNNSRYSEGELISLLREADVRVYAVSMFERPRSLERMAEETGGRAFWVKRIEDLPAAVETLSRQIRSEYMIGYDPGDVPSDGKYHRIRIEVRPPAGVAGLRASWRHGYTARE
jgi:Ca-activated chloride channel family protein